MWLNGAPDELAGLRVEREAYKPDRLVGGENSVFLLDLPRFAAASAAMVA
jgi:hypothetical protein